MYPLLDCSVWSVLGVFTCTVPDGAVRAMLCCKSRARARARARAACAEKLGWVERWVQKRSEATERPVPLDGFYFYVSTPSR